MPENRKDPGSSLTRRSAGLLDPTSLWSFRWPSSQIKNQTQWLINIGLMTLFPRQWLKIGHRALKKTDYKQTFNSLSQSLSAIREFVQMSYVRAVRIYSGKHLIYMNLNIYSHTLNRLLWLDKSGCIKWMKN